MRVSPYHPTWGPVVRLIQGVTEPILNPIRRLLPPMGGLDFSPMVVLLLARLLQGVVINLVPVSYTHLMKRTTGPHVGWYGLTRTHDRTMLANNRT